MEIGAKIRYLRLERNVTQEALAEYLGVSPQAVSKWERGAAAPDIGLLPALSVFFGVRIDDFFALSDRARLDRINRMMEHEGFLSQSDFDYAERFLKDLCTADPNRAEAFRMLTDLYNHRADGYHRKAEALCKRAIELEPAEKEGHSLLSYAAGGACWDWCLNNHHELIDYYYEFTAKHPDDRGGYLWLLYNLLADGRLDEAERVTDSLEGLGDSYHVPLYRGQIASMRGDLAAAEAHWRSMKDRWPDSWVIWSCVADCYVKPCRYDEAVEHYRRAAELEPPPRYIDNWASIAEIRRIQKRYAEAAAAYDMVADIQIQDANMAEDAFHVRKNRRLAQQLRSMCSDGL